MMMTTQTLSERPFLLLFLSIIIIKNIKNIENIENIENIKNNRGPMSISSRVYCLDFYDWTTDLLGNVLNLFSTYSRRTGWLIVVTTRYDRVAWIETRQHRQHSQQMVHSLVWGFIFWFNQSVYPSIRLSVYLSVCSSFFSLFHFKLLLFLTLVRLIKLIRLCLVDWEQRPTPRATSSTTATTTTTIRRLETREQQLNNETTIAINLLKNEYEARWPLYLYKYEEKNQPTNSKCLNNNLWPDVKRLAHAMATLFSLLTLFYNKIATE